MEHGYILKDFQPLIAELKNMGELTAGLTVGENGLLEGGPFTIQGGFDVATGESRSAVFTARYPQRLPRKTKKAIRKVRHGRDLTEAEWIRLARVRFHLELVQKR